MYRSLTLVPLVSALAALQAQPVLTHATNAPQPGSFFTWQEGEYMDPGPGGANATWDMSGLVSDSQINVLLMDPSTLPGAPLFPNATVAEFSDGMETYLRADMEGIFLLGHNDNDGYVMVYGDPGKYMQFPCTYQTTWTDNAMATFVVEDITASRTVSISANADAYGTLILPDGQVDNVLRLHIMEVIEDESEEFDMVATNDHHIYYAQGYDYPVLHLTNSMIDMMGFEMIDQFARWRSDIGTSLQEKANIAALEVFPNPASDMITLTLPGAGSHHVELTDAGGRLILQKQATGERFTLDVQDLDRGLYILGTISASGERFQQRIVLH
jgi:hypothetical protein